MYINFKAVLNQLTVQQDFGHPVNGIISQGSGFPARAGKPPAHAGMPAPRVGMFPSRAGMFPACEDLPLLSFLSCW